MTNSMPPAPFGFPSFGQFQNVSDVIWNNGWPTYTQAQSPYFSSVIKSNENQSPSADTQSWQGVQNALRDWYISQAKTQKSGYPSTESLKNAYEKWLRGGSKPSQGPGGPNFFDPMDTD